MPKLQHAMPKLQRAMPKLHFSTTCDGKEWYRIVNCEDFATDSILFSCQQNSDSIVKNNLRTFSRWFFKNFAPFSPGRFSAWEGQLAKFWNNDDCFWFFWWGVVADSQHQLFFIDTPSWQMNWNEMVSRLCVCVCVCDCVCLLAIYFPGSIVTQPAAGQSFVSIGAGLARGVGGKVRWSRRIFF